MEKDKHSNRKISKEYEQALFKVSNDCNCELAMVRKSILSALLKLTS